MSGAWRDHPAAARVEILDPDAGTIAVTPPRKKLAIVGAAPSKAATPWHSDEWLIVGINELYLQAPRADLWIEIHPRTGPGNFLEDTVAGTDYLGWLRTCPVPVFMIERHADIPSSMRFPLEAASAIVPAGHDWYECSFAYLLAWGLACGSFEEIGVYGVDLVSGSEWEYQRPNAEFWRGVAAARGVRVTIPPSSSLGRGSVRHYGYERPAVLPDEVRFLDGRLERLTDALIDIERAEYALHAALAEAKYLRAQRYARQRGLRAGPEEGDWLPDLLSPRRWAPPRPKED